MIAGTMVGSLGRLRRGAVLSALLILAGCADYHLTVPSSDPFTPRGQEGAYKS